MNDRTGGIEMHHTIHIAIIDDQLEDRKKLNELLQQRFSLHKNVSLYIDEYEDSSLLKQRIQKYQCVYLDVEMPDCNGLLLAKEIRDLKTDIILIFISSFTNYVFQSFDVRPFSYILKSNLEKDGIKEIDRFISYYREQNQIYILNHLPLKQSTIEWIIKEGNDCIFFYLGKQYRTRDTIKNLLLTLTDYFLLINKSEIVNMYFINKISNFSVHMQGGEVFYISKRKLPKVMKNYHAFLKTKHRLKS